MYKCHAAILQKQIFKPQKRREPHDIAYDSLKNFNITAYFSTKAICPGISPVVALHLSRPSVPKQ